MEVGGVEDVQVKIIANLTLTHTHPRTRMIKQGARRGLNAKSGKRVENKPPLNY